jgi:integrase
LYLKPYLGAILLRELTVGHVYAAYHLIALRGLRRGEAAGLRWCDLDLDGGAAVISQQLQQYDGRVVSCRLKTRHSARVIALDRTTITALRQHRARQEAERAAAGESYHDSGYVFTSLVGDPMAPDRLTRIFQQLCRAADMPPIRLHDLRHGAATLAFRGLRVRCFAIGSVLSVSVFAGSSGTSPVLLPASAAA